MNCLQIFCMLTSFILQIYRFKPYSICFIKQCFTRERRRIISYHIHEELKTYQQKPKELILLFSLFTKDSHVKNNFDQIIDAFLIENDKSQVLNGLGLLFECFFELISKISSGFLIRAFVNRDITIRR